MWHVQVPRLKQQPVTDPQKNIGNTNHIYYINFQLKALFMKAPRLINMSFQKCDIRQTFQAPCIVVEENAEGESMQVLDGKIILWNNLHF